MSKGLLQIYTGKGKGKTTASVGLALRAHCQGLRVIYAQFMKSAHGGELDGLHRVGINVMRLTEIKSPLFNPDVPIDDIQQAALRAIDDLAVAMNDADLIVLDEFIHLIRPGLLSDEQARRFIRSRPEGVEMVLTGRDAPRWLIEMADLVTEMKEIKHPAGQGTKARKGIEY